MSLSTEISKVFQLDPTTDSNIIQELQNLCTVFSLAPDKLKTKWEAFALTTHCDLKPSLAPIKILKNALQRESERALKNRRTVKGKVMTKRATVSGIDLSEFTTKMTVEDDPVDNFMKSIMKNSNTPQNEEMSQAASQFINRPNSHVLDTQYNSHLPFTSSDNSMIDDDIPCTIDQLFGPYRFMHEKVKDIAEGLDDRIDYLGSLIGEHYHIEAFANPTKISQEAVYAYGLIRSEASEFKLDSRALVLETSRDLGMGRRVALDVSKVDSFSLFPGQVVGLKGTNHTGARFHVDQILLPPCPPKITGKAKQNKTIHMVVATGPFTLDSDLSYSPFEALLMMCVDQKPDAVVLLGPFFSIHHPKLATLESLPEQVVQDQMMANIEALLRELPHTHVYLVPHADDVAQLYSVFPQPPPTWLNMEHPRIHVASNPTTISVNGHGIAISNIDVLFKLGKEETVKNPQETDRFSRLTQHLLQQHSYYPLYPHGLKDNIDAERMVDLQITSVPDILITPSQFKHFVKVVDNTVCINPGHLCKHQAGGTYARILLYPDMQHRVDLFKL